MSGARNAAAALGLGVRRKSSREGGATNRTFTNIRASRGAMLLRSARPSLASMEGYLSAQFAEYGEQRYEGAISTPLSDTLAVRIAGLYTNRDGWATNTVNITTPFRLAPRRFGWPWLRRISTLRAASLIEVGKSISAIGISRSIRTASCPR